MNDLQNKFSNLTLMMNSFFSVLEKEMDKVEEEITELYLGGGAPSGGARA